MPTTIDQVRITKTFAVDHWVVSAELVAPGSGRMPRSVFIYENTGTTDLGVYWGVCGIDELQRLQEWSGTATQKFGNRFVRHDTAEVHLHPGVHPDLTVSAITRGLKNLRVELLAIGDSSSVYSIE